MSHPTSPVVRNFASVKPEVVGRSRGAEIQILIGPADDAPNFSTRRFTLAAGGRIPRHLHPTIEHEQVILSGSMVIGLDARESEVIEGDSIFIPAGVAHWYENRTDERAVHKLQLPHESLLNASRMTCSAFLLVAGANRSATELCHANRSLALALVTARLLSSSLEFGDSKTRSAAPSDCVTTTTSSRRAANLPPVSTAEDRRKEEDQRDDSRIEVFEIVDRPFSGRGAKRFAYA